MAYTIPGTSFRTAEAEELYAVASAAMATWSPRPERAAAWAALRERVHALDVLGLHEAVAGRETASA